MNQPRLCMKWLLTIVSCPLRPRIGIPFTQIFHKNHIRIDVKSNFSSGVLKSSKVVVPQQPIDLLMQNIRSANDTSDVLYNVQQHHAIMNDTHVVQALQSIFTLQKSLVSTMTNGELVKHESFQLLCKILQQKLRFLDLNEQLNSLKVLSFVGVPSTIKVMQILLQLVSKRVNELSLQQIVFLEFILKDFESTPLVDALKIALPIVFEAHFKLHSDISDLKILTELFVYAIKRKLSDQCLDLFIEKINDNKHNIDVETSKIIVRTLCEVRRDNTSVRNLLHQSLDNIVDNINKFSFLDLNYILARLTSNFNKRTGDYYYHEEFVNAIGKFVVENKCDSEQVTWVLKSCNKFKHMHLVAVDYINQIVAKNPYCLEKWSVGMLVTFLNSLSISDYRPENFDMYQGNLISSLFKFTNKLELPWLRVALDLCTLDCWPHELFNVIFETDFLHRFLKRGNIEDLHELLELYQAVVTLCPSYTGNLPSECLINEVISKTRKLLVPERSPLSVALIQGLGGPSYVHSPVTTKLGHVIDHAVVMRKGGFPVSINNWPEKENNGIAIVEDLDVPEDSQIVLVVFLTPKYYTLNTERIMGHVRLNINSLEAMGYAVMPVMQGSWNNLLDNEKIPYLMQALQSKSEKLEHVSASST